MKTRTEQTDYETRQYVQQANLVYYGTIGALVFLLPLYYIMGSMIVLALNMMVFIVTLFVIRLNNRHRYGLASLLFITLISIASFAGVVIYGDRAGFQFYFFNMSVLIIFTNWPIRRRMIGIAIEAFLIIGAYVHTLLITPVEVIPTGLLTTMFVINVGLNLFGIVNSSAFHMNIARSANQALRVMATTDDLSKLMNRVTFNKNMIEINPVAAPYLGSMGVLMLDIDHFKDINDTFGHLCGDEMIRQFSRLLSKTMAPNDLLVRYGGEEFTMVIFHDDYDAIFQKAEAIRQDVMAYGFVFEDRVIKLTVSIGLLYKPSGRTALTRDVISQADDLLYQAKNQGRNQVVSKHI
ncbi:MAG: GGDEF domain-containing protein [Acholeplasmataceae bacterium]|nr:GGDEF domain-containing protein [Acholeplasmataceae bacterium]